jgi:hypothetical protein
MKTTKRHYFGILLVASIAITQPSSPPREPIVIIPGIMGTALDRVADNREIWPDVGLMISSPADDYLDALTFTAAGAQTIAIAPGGILRSAAGISFYGNLIAAFEKLGYSEQTNLVLAPYDWRQSVASSAAAIAPVIARAMHASPNGKIIIIAHSMGGLVLKAYLAMGGGTNSTAAPAAAAIDKIIMVAVPQFGAPEAFKILNYGDDLGLGFLGIGLNHNEVKRISQNMPAAYELLPSRTYFQNAGAYIRDAGLAINNAAANATTLTYDQTLLRMATGGHGLGALNLRLLRAADTLHQKLDAPQSSAQPDPTKTWSVVGCRASTIGGFSLYANGIVVETQHVSGDGTVPLASALIASAAGHSYFVRSDKTGINHIGLISDSRTVSLITKIALGTIPTAATLPANLSPLKNICN